MVEDVGTIEEFMKDNPYSPFPQVMITERPDRVAGNIVEGRVCIMVDCSPFAMIMPVTLASLYQSPEDYYERPLYGTGVRILYCPLINVQVKNTRYRRISLIYAGWHRFSYGVSFVFS